MEQKSPMLQARDLRFRYDPERPRQGGRTACDEIGLPVSATGGVVPCGATALWESC